MDKSTGILSCEPSSVSSYFDFYSKLSNQQNMLQDFIRTKTYFNSINQNITDFHNKIVMDVGTGSGILAIFSALAGAKHVYAIEASNSAIYAKKLIETNNLQEKITLINDKLESDQVKNLIKEKVDVIISEPLGIMLVNERMLETYLLARDLFLTPGGKMFPNKSVMHFIPFSDEVLYNEQLNKVKFWSNTDFFNVDLTSLYEIALKEKFAQPVIEAYNPNCHVSNETCIKIFDFMTMEPIELKDFSIKLKYVINKACIVHGISGWFDTVFSGSTSEVVLSTSPRSPTTHWYQVRFLLLEPLALNKGQVLKGSIDFQANNLQSYSVSLKLKIEGYNIKQECSYDLKNPDFRCSYFNNIN